jgi:lipopolysaccharide export system protein LptA
MKRAFSIGSIKWAAACVLGLAVSSPAHAQFAANSNAPIIGGADQVEYERDYSVFSGQVDVRQDDVRILSDVMKVYSGQGGSGQQAFDNVQRIEALGNFYYITPEQEVKGDQGVYERAKDNFIVTGNVILLQGEDNVVTGDRLVYNLSNNKAVMTGSCKGRRCGRNGRVNILIKNTNGQR